MAPGYALEVPTTTPRLAAYGALAGPPSATSAFVRGLHVAGVATAALWLVAAVATAAFVTDRARPDH